MTPIGFLVKTYPKISETFILEEILGLEQMGIPLHLFSLQAPTDRIAHADTVRVQAPLTYLRPGFWRGLGELARHPLRALRALWMLATQTDVGLRELLLAADLAPKLRRGGIRHLHSHFISEPATVAQIAALLAGASFSVSAHAKDIYLSEPATLRRKLGAARFTVTCTEHNLGYLSALAPLGAAVSRMYHGIDLDQFRRLDTAPREPAPLILAVGRLKPKKGFHLLIDACRLLRDAGQPFRCEIVGYGEAEAELRARIHSHGLQALVSLRGKVDRAGVIERYRAASVFALPCIVADDGDRDGIPNVLLEAMAMHLPVVTTAVSGIPEMIGHGDNGLLVTPNDPPALAQALGQLLADERLCARLGARGRQTVAERCCNSRNLQHLRQLLTRCNETPAGTSPSLDRAHAQL